MLNVRSYSFSQKTMNKWNKVSAQCVHSSSNNMFKNRIARKSRKHLDSYSGLSISQRRPCSQPAVAWVAILLNTVESC